MNLFARAALLMAPGKKLGKDVKKGLIAPYNSWKNRVATLKFVQDIPLWKTDPSYGVAEETGKKLHLLSHVPMLILWGKRDFVFDMSYLSLWRQRFPEAGVHLFEKAGHYILEDEWQSIVPLIRDFMRNNPGSEEQPKGKLEHV